MGCSDGPWFPTIYSDKCDGCAKTGKPRCIEFCPNNVFTFKDGKAEVTNPASCGVGRGTFHCSACAPPCPKNAIVFPSNFSLCCISPRRRQQRLASKNKMPGLRENILDKQFPKSLL